MDALIVFLYIIAIIAFIILSWYLANRFYDVACEKGFDEKHYFWIAFFLGLIGYLLVIALPDRKKETVTKTVQPLCNTAPVQRPVKKWICPDCGEPIPYDVIKCKCGYTK